ncbi:MAG: prephenate dehydrogenase/arogenate dehydrogenase family protein [Ruminococcus sp.]|nr:prephenate dehydrogenase/arogenate dehydrogenase family protein [Ruminococcus sp.]
MNILVVGIGLIGGSVCKTLKKKCNYTIHGCDIDETVLKSAMNEGVIDGIGKMEDGIYDICIVCLHQRAAQVCMKQALPFLKKGSILMDMCGLKGQMVLEFTNACRILGISYVGTHPMAGRERSGYAVSIPDLFENANFIITPTYGTNNEAVEKVSLLAKEMGFGKIVLTTPHRHDDMIAYTSQLAHIVSSAYVKDDCMDDAVSFSGGSFQDMTRVATMDEKMWSSLFMDNRLLLLHHLELLIAHLSEYRMALETQDEMALQLLIADGRRVQEENVRKRRKDIEEKEKSCNELDKG